MTPLLPSTIGAEVDLLGHDPVLHRWIEWKGFVMVSGDHFTYRMRRTSPEGAVFLDNLLRPIAEPRYPSCAGRFIKPVV